MTTSPDLRLNAQSAGQSAGQPAALSGVRLQVRATPAYPFTPVSAAVKLDQNESPEDFPAALKGLAVERMAAREWNRYPDLHADSLRAAIGRYEDWDPEGVAVTPGSNVLIKALVELGGIGQRLVVTRPTFSVYTLEGQLLGAQLTEVPLRPDFGLDVPAMQQALAAGGPGVLALIQPHAPTGFLDAQADVRAVVEAAGNDWIVVLDEAYHQYSASDYRSLVRERPNVLSVRTFSKAWGLAGLRLGYALGSPALAGNIQKLLSAFNVNALTQTAAEVALEHPEYVRQRVAQTVAERDRMLAALSGLKTMQALPSQANFFLLRTPDPDHAYQFLLGKGLLVRRQDKLPMLGGCLRVSVGLPEQNDLLLGAVLELDRQHG